MSNIYLKVTMGGSQNFDFLGLKNLSPICFGQLQLTQILLNFKTSCCNLKMKRLRAKQSVAFPLF